MQHYTVMVENFLQFDGLVNNGRAALLWPTILCRCFRDMIDDSLVTMLVKLIMRGHQNQMNATNLHHFCECCAGVGNLTRELLRIGASGSAFDSNYMDEHNILDSSGLLLVLNAVGARRRKGLLWLGTPCSSFVVLCRAQSMRDASNSWLGDTSRSFVSTGNCLGELSALLFFVAWCLNIWAILEQPQSSCLPLMATMHAVLRFCEAHRYTTYMGQYGGASAKPLQLWSQWSSVTHLECSRPEGGGEALVIRDGTAFTGCKELLEQSQIYTPAFGRAVARICQDEWSL